MAPMNEDTRSAVSTIAVAPSPVAETIRRVHQQLRDGQSPSFEAVMAGVGAR